MPQAARLWDADHATCRTLLQHLVRESFLQVNDTGKYSLARKDRRRATRATPGPLRVRVRDSGAEGVLINISEGGALVQLPTPVVLNVRIVLELQWEHATLLLHGRVVRSNPATVQSATQPSDHYVAVAFAASEGCKEGGLRDLLRS